MDEFLMKPKNDYAFKEIMADETVRIGFLSAVLKLKPEEIDQTILLNTNVGKVHWDDKLGILDVRVLLNSKSGKSEIDIEIQVAPLKVWASRTLFYLANMLTEQIRQSDTYDVIKKCINISVLDFELFPGEKEFYSCFHLREDNRHDLLYTDKVEFHVIELPKLPAELRDDNILLWSKFIASERKEEFDMLAQKSPYLAKAYAQLQVISQDREKRLEYEAREKAIRDYNQGMKEAREDGLEEGLKKGICQVACNLLKQGLGMEQIAAATGLTAEQLQALQ